MWLWINVVVIALIWLTAATALFDQTYGWWAGTRQLFYLPIHSDSIFFFFALYAFGTVLLIVDIYVIIRRESREQKLVYWLYPLVLLIGLFAIWVPGDLANALTVRILGPGDRAGVLLVNAASSGRPSTVRALLDSGVQVDSHSPGGNTALHYAASRGRVEIMELLIDRGANVNQVGMNGLMPLHYAEQNKNEGAIKLLLAHGARKYN